MNNKNGFVLNKKHFAKNNSLKQTCGVRAGLEQNEITKKNRLVLKNIILSKFKKAYGVRTGLKQNKINNKN